VHISYYTRRGPPSRASLERAGLVLPVPARILQAGETSVEPATEVR
jgi:hypothetical protein